MAENVTLAPLATLQNSSIISTVNANNTIITNAFVDCLSLAGNQPNAMQSNLDMNSNQIINLPVPSTIDSPVRLADLQSLNIGLDSTNTITFDILSEFLQTSNIPSFFNYVTVNAVTGTYPATDGTEATSLTYQRVSSSSGLYGEVTVNGQIYSPVYSTNPVNMGEFGIVSDAIFIDTQHSNITATANGTNVLNCSNTSGIIVGMFISNVSWATLGAGVALPANTTIISFVPNVSITISQSAPSSGTFDYVCWIDTVSGTNNTPMMQACINWAIQHSYSDIKIPVGKYKTVDTINVGQSSGFCQIRLIGSKRASYLGQIGPGPIIYSTLGDRPCINFQGLRNGGMYGITLIGLNFLYALLGQGKNNVLSSNKNDWLAPNLTPTGTNPGGITVSAPYVGVTVDAYSGTQPTIYYTNNIYGASFSSDIMFEECEIDGFGVGICVHPNSSLDSDGNGDFIKFRNINVSACPYGIAICQSQSRGVELRNLNFQALYTCFTTKDFGVKKGVIDGPIDNCIGQSVYQLFNIELVYSGPLIISSVYSENTVRIGNFTATSAICAPVIFEGGQLYLNSGVHGQIPPTYISGTASATHIVVNGLQVSGNPRISNWIDNCASLTFKGGLWSAAVQSGTTAALQQAVNFCGGCLAGGAKWNTSLKNFFSIQSQLNASYYATVGGGLGTLIHDDEIRFTSSGGSLNRSPITQAARTYRDVTQRSWRITNTLPGSFVMTNVGSVPVAPAWVNDVMTFGYSSTLQTSTSPLCTIIDVGDILYNNTTQAVFVVTAVSAPVGGVYTITTQQQNCLKVDVNNVFVLNYITDFTLAGTTFVIKTGAIAPAQLEYATFTSGNTSLTNVNRGDGNGSDFSTYYSNGDILFGGYLAPPITYEASPLKWPIGTSKVTLSAVTNGTSPGGSATLSSNALSTGVFPLFPYELR